MEKGILEILERKKLIGAKDTEAKPYFVSVIWENKKLPSGGGCINTIKELNDFFKKEPFQNCIILAEKPIGEMKVGTWALNRYTTSEAKKLKNLSKFIRLN